MTPLGSYNQELLEHCFSSVDCMAAYPNTLGVLVASEVINSHASTAAAPVIRAVTRDIKKYMAMARKTSEQRVLPAGYSAADVRMVTRSTFDYLTAGSRDESIDFYCVSRHHECSSNASHC